MDLAAFRASLSGDTPPTDDLALQALWREANGDWDAAHDLTNQAGGGDGAWVHAYLHRKEGDASNARYWYDRCGRESCARPLQDEWNEIASELLRSQEPSSS